MSEKTYAGYTEGDILKSLKMIQDICKKTKDCYQDCPFMNSDQGCNIIEHVPASWSLEDRLPKKWSPFK